VAPARTILFAPLAEAGHHAGTFRLARRLAGRGHRVLYLGLEDLRPLVEGQGFELVPFAEDLLPAGHLAARSAARAGARPGRSERRRRRRADEALFAAWLERIAGGALDERLRASGADVVVCDTFVWYVALRALALGLPVVDLSIILSLRPNPVVPPITSTLGGGDSPLGRLRVRAAWTALRLRFLVTKELASRLTGRFRAPTRTHHLVGVFRALARRSGYPLAENRTWYFGEMGPRLALPEIVLCPRAFQLPGGPDDERTHVADFIDFERVEPPLGEPLDERRPLIYLSLGSGPSFYPESARFFAAVADAARSRPDWQLVLHVGDAAGLAATLAPPANLVVRARLPQLRLLERAAVMVGHGGINSVLECVAREVPMVLLPAARDQPGNAVRAARLGIARVGELRSITAGRLVELIDGVLHDPSQRAAVARFRAEVEAEGGLDRAVALIEARAASRGARPGS
jgi:UDP:flavonoid glycosyltransferase YjiC (YdhE family)